MRESRPVRDDATDRDAARAAAGADRRTAPPLGPARMLVRQAERAMVRASDAPLVGGNSARLLVDGPAAFQAWLRAIEAAEKWIHLENYIIRDDRTGRTFRDALAERAAAGVKVRVMYDWLGCWATPTRFWRPLRDAGADVRAFAPPSFSDPLNGLRRDHRKVVCVDGSYASVGGMCIGDDWAGDAAAGVPPWRDMGVEVRGPVAALIDGAFARSWSAVGETLPPEEIPDPARIAPTGNVSVRVVEGEPGKSRIYRLSQFIAVGVGRRLWITDPYFVTPPAMTEALAAAARDGVDVRILVPAFNNWPIVGGFSRAGYRPLLEAGVRLFEWEGPMIHAKTTVADGVWTRVGSSNLNLASLLGNWELDLAIMDRGIGKEMEDIFLRDLHSAVEVKLHRNPPTPSGHLRMERSAVLHAPEDPEVYDVQAAREARRRAPTGSWLGRVLSRVARAGSVLGRALVGERNVGREDAGWIAAISAFLFALAAIGFVTPRVLAWPLAFVLFWLGIAALVRVFPPRPQK